MKRYLRFRSAASLIVLFLLITTSSGGILAAGPTQAVHKRPRAEKADVTPWCTMTTPGGGLFRYQVMGLRWDLGDNYGVKGTTKIRQPYVHEGSHNLNSVSLITPNGYVENGWVAERYSGGQPSYWFFVQISRWGVPYETLISINPYFFNTSQTFEIRQDTSTPRWDFYIGLYQYPHEWWMSTYYLGGQRPTSQVEGCTPWDWLYTRWWSLQYIPDQNGSFQSWPQLDISRSYTPGTSFCWYGLKLSNESWKSYYFSNGNC